MSVLAHCSEAAVRSPEHEKSEGWRLSCYYTHHFSVLSSFVKLKMIQPPNHGGTKAILCIGLSSKSPLNFWKCISNEITGKQVCLRSLGQMQMLFLIHNAVVQDEPLFCLQFMLSQFQSKGDYRQSNKTIIKAKTILRFLDKLW